MNVSIDVLRNGTLARLMTSTRHTRPLADTFLSNRFPSFILLVTNTTRMPHLNDNHERQLHELEHGARTGTLKAWDSFSNFALRDNVLEVAVGLM